MITLDGVLENLKKLIGTEFDYDEVICAFEDFEEDGEASVYVGESQNVGYDYIAYIESKNSTQFCFLCNEDVITDIWIYRVD